MYYVLYDRNFKSFDGAFKVESWKRIQRAYDFDNFTIIGEIVKDDFDAFFITLNDDNGSILFSGLASTPSIDKKSVKATLYLKDYLTLLNYDMIIDLSLFSTVSELMNNINTQYIIGNNGLTNIILNTAEIDNIILDYKKEKGNYKASDIVKEIMAYYGIYIDYILDINNKQLIVNFKKVGTYTKKIDVNSFEIETVFKDYGETTKASIYDKDMNLIEIYCLGKDNEIHKLPTASELKYPLKNKNFIQKDSETSIQNARYNAIMELAKNRYKESFKLNDYSNYFSDVTFSTAFELYTENGLYKKIPVGEIETDSNGKRIIQIGYRVQLLTQIL